MAKTAGVVIIGNEILSGKVQDVNAAYLLRELRLLGVDVKKVSVIPDEIDIIALEVSAFSRQFDIVFTSGGVGPTHDDVSIEGIAKAFGRRVIRHPELERLLRLIEREHVAHERLDVYPALRQECEGSLVFPV